MGYGTVETRSAPLVRQIMYEPGHTGLSRSAPLVRQRYGTGHTGLPQKGTEPDIQACPKAHPADITKDADAAPGNLESKKKLCRNRAARTRAETRKVPRAAAAAAAAAAASAASAASDLYFFCSCSLEILERNCGVTITQEQRYGYLLLLFLACCCCCELLLLVV